MLQTVAIGFLIQHYRGQTGIGKMVTAIYSFNMYWLLAKENCRVTDKVEVEVL